MIISIWLGDLGILGAGIMTGFILICVPVSIFFLFFGKQVLLWMLIVFSENEFFTVKIKVKVGDHCQGWLEGSLFNSYYTEV